jgi:hypothetical protein
MRLITLTQRNKERNTMSDNLTNAIELYREQAEKEEEEEK